MLPLSKNSCRQTVAPHLRLLADDELAMPDCIDDGDVHPVLTYFKGGHVLTAGWKAYQTKHR